MLKSVSLIPFPFVCLHQRGRESLLLVSVQHSTQRPGDDTGGFRGADLGCTGEWHQAKPLGKCPWCQDQSSHCLTYVTPGSGGGVTRRIALVGFSIWILKIKKDKALWIQIRIALLLYAFQIGILCALYLYYRGLLWVVLIRW